MRWYTRWSRRLRGLAHNDVVEGEMDAEMRFHLEMEAAELARTGLTREEAWRRARLAFGGVEAHKEDGRDARGTRWLDDLWRDIRYAFRMLRRSPGFAAVTVLTIALGIAANAAIFGVVNGILFKPMPYADASRLMFIWDGLDWIGVPEAWISGPEVIRMRKDLRQFDGFAALQAGSAALTEAGPGEPEQVRTTAASANLFDLLGVRPAIGRTFLPNEEGPGAENVVVLSHGLWLRRFGADPKVLGRTISLDGQTGTVIGVLPKEFTFAMQTSLGAATAPDIYLPLRVALAEVNPGNHQFGVLARVKAGVSIASAEAELAALSVRLDEEVYGKNKFRFKPAPVRDRLVRDVRPALLALLGAVGLLLLIMCANLAMLSLARWARRERELAVRKALGAGRTRVARQLLTETVVVSLLGAAIGIGLGVWGISGLLAIAPEGLPRRDEIGIDPMVLGVTLGIAVLVGLGMGIAPAMQSMRRDVTSVLRERAPTAGTRGARGMLVLAQVALSIVLLSGTGLLLSSFVRLTRVDPGFSSGGVLTVDLRALRAKYPHGPEVVDFYSRLLPRLAAIPGVGTVGAVSAAPLSAEADQSDGRFLGAPTNTGDPRHDLILFDHMSVTPGYFAAMGISLLAGRDFSVTDAPGSPRVAIIDESLAKRVFPNMSAVGQRMAFSDTVPVTIVGVVRHARLYRIHEDDRVQVYQPHTQLPFRGMTIALRTTGDPTALAPAVRAAVREIDRDQPLARIRTMASVVATSLAERRLVLQLVAAFAAAALLLAALGVYGVASSAVTQRTRELGIRVALGAESRKLLWLVLWEPMRLVTLGVGLGLIGTVAATRLVRRLLYGVSPTDPMTLGAVAVVLMVVAIVAGYLPARRATRVDPMVALRGD